VTKQSKRTSNLRLEICARFVIAILLIIPSYYDTHVPVI